MAGVMVGVLSACGGGTTDKARDETPDKTPDEAVVAITTDAAQTTPADDAEVATPVAMDDPSSAESADNAAKMDVAQLSVKIAMWYIDNDGPPPAITADGTNYFVEGEQAGFQGAGVEFGGATGTGWEDWCVWVTNPAGEVKDFHERANGVVEPGTC